MTKRRFSLIFFLLLLLSGYFVLKDAQNRDQYLDSFKHIFMAVKNIFIQSYFIAKLTLRDWKFGVSVYYDGTFDSVSSSSEKNICDMSVVIYRFVSFNHARLSVISLQSSQNIC